MLPVDIIDTQSHPFFILELCRALEFGKAEKLSRGDYGHYGDADDDAEDDAEDVSPEYGEGGDEEGESPTLDDRQTATQATLSIIVTI